MRRPLHPKSNEAPAERLWKLPHVRAYTESETRRKNLRSWQWNPSLTPPTCIVLVPSRDATSPVVVTKIHRNSSPIEARIVNGEKTININTVVTSIVDLMFYDHRSRSVVRMAEVEVPAIAMARLYQAPHHGPAIDDAWLAVPMRERVAQGLYARVCELDWVDSEPTSNRVDVQQPVVSTKIEKRQLA